MAHQNGASEYISPDTSGVEITAMTDDSSCGCNRNSEVDCKPTECIYDSDHDENAHKYRICCDANGCCCKYPCSCRNPFWPEFAHPRWLCCRDLYNGEAESCYDNE